MNSFIDTISNSQNHNWIQEDRETNLGLLTSAFYLGSALGSLFVGLFTTFNTRHLYAVLRILTGLSLLPIVFGSLPWMVFGRFFLGFFFDAGMEVSLWSMHQILLPRHKDSVLTLYYFMASIGYLFWNTAAVFDDGGPVYWRVCFLAHVVLFLLTALGSLMFIPHINSLTYLMLSEETEEGVVEIISHYYERETALFLIKKYKEEFEQLLKIDEIETELENIVVSEASGQDDQQKKAQNGENSNKEEHNQKRGKLGDQSNRKRRNGAINSFETFFRDLRVYNKEAVHIIIFSITSMLCFHESLYEYSIYYGAKELNEVEAVTETKKYLIASSFTKMVTCFVVGFWALTRYRRLALLLSHSATLVCLALIGLAFYMENLKLSRMIVAIFPIGTVGLYTTNFIYANDICPPSLFALNHFLVRGVPMLFGIVLLPYYLKFEELSYQEVAWRIFGLVGVGLVSLAWLFFYMVESSEVSRVQVYRYFREGKWTAEKEFDENELHEEVLRMRSYPSEDYVPKDDETYLKLKEFS